MVSAIKRIPRATKSVELTMMDMMHGMGWGMGAAGLLLLIFVILAIAALVKYLFFR